MCWKAESKRIRAHLAMEQLVQVDLHALDLGKGRALPEVVDIEAVTLGTNDQWVRRERSKVGVQLVYIFQIVDAQADGVEEEVAGVPPDGGFRARDVEDV